MIRKFALAALASSLAVPAYAGEAAVSPADAAEFNSKALSLAASQKDAFQHLARQGYVNIALTERDDDGRWVGTAYKDGRTVIVAVDLRRAPAINATN